MLDGYWTQVAKSFYTEIVKALFILLELWQVAWLEDLCCVGEKNPNTESRLDVIC